MVLNIITPVPQYESPPSSPKTPRLLRRKSICNSPHDPFVEEVPLTITPAPAMKEPETYGSPSFTEIETEFKNQLLSFTTDLLLSDLDMIKNISERGNKVIFYPLQLKQLIAILYLKREDRPRYEDLIDIETEPVVVHNCFCKDCTNPFYEKIKEIHVNRSVNFLSTAHAVNMSSVFRISLSFCLRRVKKL
jgi:hypothetical protein